MLWLIKISPEKPVGITISPDPLKKSETLPDPPDIVKPGVLVYPDPPDG